MRVALRIGASADMSPGHFLRCLALAHALEACGSDVRFVTHPLGLENAPRAIGLVVLGLRMPAGAAPPDEVPHAASVCTGRQADADKTSAAAGNARPHERVTVDYYAYDERSNRAVAARPWGWLAFVDDVAVCALLLGHNLAPGHRTKYYNNRQPAAAALLGLALPEAPRCAPRPQVRSIGAFTRATDAACLSLAALRGCLEVARFEGPFEVVAMCCYAQRVGLTQATVRHSPSSMSVELPDVASRHDLHIGADGDASLERGYIGVATVALVSALNRLAVIPEPARCDAREIRRTGRTQPRARRRLGGPPGLAAPAYARPEGENRRHGPHGARVPPVLR
jgi:hypothetical protein